MRLCLPSDTSGKGIQQVTLLYLFNVFIFSTEGKMGVLVQESRENESEEEEDDNDEKVGG